MSIHYVILTTIIHDVFLKCLNRIRKMATHTDVRLGLKGRDVAEAHPGNDIAQEGRRGRGSGAAFADGGAGCTEPQ